MKMNNELNQKVADAFKACGLIDETTETNSQYFIEVDRLSEIEAPSADPFSKILMVLADCDITEIYTGRDMFSGFSNGWLFTVREADVIRVD